MTTEFILAAIGGLALGFLIAWFLRQGALRSALSERDAARAGHEEERSAHAATRDGALGDKERLTKAIADAERAQALAESARDERVREIEALRGEIAGNRAKIDELDAHRLELIDLKRGLSEQEKAFEKREEDLNKRFAELADAALGKSTEAFLKRAEETLVRHREAADKGLQTNRAELDKLIAPMRETLVKYQERLKEVEEKRHNMFGAINSAIAGVKEGQLRVTEEAQRIVHSLRNAPKSRGRWGEQQLRNVLEMAGLSQHCDFQEEVHVDTGDGAIRPDVVINLPGERVLVIDAKCSLVAYQDAVAAASDEERHAHMLAHAKALRTHVDTLSRKSYTSQFEDTVDFVIMFVPGENFLAAALEVDQELFESAFQKRVLLASPTNLIAIARTVAMVWQQEKAAENVREIAALGKELYDRLATMGEHVARVGRNLEQATGAYNKMVGSLESQVLTSARRFRDLEIEPPKKDIDLLEPTSTEPRELTKLEVGSADDREAAE
ncbi:hypothetical protein B5C34_06720 [Pacificimonas flava]|uniref:DNA recombination protein RmuC homolog n=2 Tax=Pacificimonas TaxID=1960290 RepID=A0A219B4S5_9SPHN|nr:MULTISPECIES: DNA recombination protein RmuC [Pacificimonas]MBZ6377084.1 DNA recombination protein RmuC [Pacificimonas aurantium]OWV33184.1 hypothetical protein B5C34_06720 [Pacificimonas flava]